MNLVYKFHISSEVLTYVHNMGEDGHEGWDRRMDSPEKDLLVTYIIKFKKA